MTQSYIILTIIITYTLKEYNIMEDKDKLYEGLINILKMFKNRPYHLAKYLIDSNAFNDSFVKKMVNSKKPTKLPIVFKDINEMNDYFNSIIDDGIKEKTPQELSIELNNKLTQLLKDEKYEEAIYLRDYMNKNNITRINS